jgi:hypothetical protein
MNSQCAHVSSPQEEQVNNRAWSCRALASSLWLSYLAWDYTQNTERMYAVLACIPPSWPSTPDCATIDNLSASLQMAAQATADLKLAADHGQASQRPWPWLVRRHDGTPITRDDWVAVACRAGRPPMPAQHWVSRGMADDSGVALARLGRPLPACSSAPGGNVRFGETGFRSL